MRSKTETWLRGFVAITMLIGMLGWANGSEAAPAADVVGNTWTSPQFPTCSITWTDSWFLVEETSTDYDAVQLTDGISYASLLASEEAGGSAVIALAYFTGGFRTDPTVSNFEPKPDEDDLITEERSFRTYTYTYTGEDFSVDYTLYMETRTIEPGSSVLLFWSDTPSDVFDIESPLIQELASTITPGVGPPPEPVIAKGEPPPVFVSGQWRLAVASASLNDSFDDLRLKAKDGKEWLVVIADVTNWSDNDGVFNAREFTVRPELDGKTVKAAPGSTKSVAKSLKLEPTSDEVTVEIPAGQTQRVVLVFTVPAHSLELLLVRESAYLPLADALLNDLDPNKLPALAVPPEVHQGEFVSASNGRTVRVQIDGGAFGSQEMRLLVVKPPAKNTC
jgi:hypothetical protein